MFSGLSSDELARRFWQERVEPDFAPRSAPRSTSQGRQPSLAPEQSAPSRRTDAARPPVGILLHLVSVGLVAAAIIAVLFGTGFFLLVPPASETIADFDRNPPRVYSNAPEADGEGALVSRETVMPHPTAGDVLPGLPRTHRLAANESAPPQPGKAVQGFPPPNGDPPAKTASVSEPASRPAVSSASLTPLASPPPFAPDAVLPGAKGQPALDGRSARPRTTSQHSRPRSARSGPKLIPQQSRFAQTLTPPPTSSFGQLLTQLTGESEPIGQALTPPRVEQPDPFAQRVWNK